MGLIAGVLAGVAWAPATPASPAVANMSLGGGKSAALDQAVTSLWNSGVFLAGAAGDDNADACDASPAGGRGGVTRAAAGETHAQNPHPHWGPGAGADRPGAATQSTPPA